MSSVEKSLNMLSSHPYLDFQSNAKENYFMQDDLKSFRIPFIEIEEMKYICNKEASEKIQLSKVKV